MEHSVLEGKWAQSRNQALIAFLLQLGVPEGNLAYCRVGMVTSSWEIPADPLRPISNATSFEMPQPPSEHSFLPYVVICVHVALWCSKHKLRDRVSVPPSNSCSEESEMQKVRFRITLASALLCAPCLSHSAWLPVGV